MTLFCVFWVSCVTLASRTWLSWCEEVEREGVGRGAVVIAYVFGALTALHYIRQYEVWWRM
jgi:hypothetical protein